MTARGLFVTGTDTGVGKTLVSCALLHALSRRGSRVIGMKPVAAGARLRDGVLVNEDVVALGEASNVSAPIEFVNPYCFASPIAPHLAAGQAGVAIDIERIRSAYQELSRHADCVVVEGAGGFRVPLGLRFDTSDLARLLGLPVVLVVGMRLGCLNHALLSAEAIRAAGLRLAGWVANHIDRDMIHACENVQALQERLHAPLLARIPYSVRPNTEIVADSLDADALDRAWH